MTSAVDNLTLQKDQVVITDQKEIEQRFLGTINPQKGQSLFELCIDTYLIRKVEPESVITIKGSIKRKFHIRKNCHYTVALNIKNAEKKFLKMFDNA